MSTCFVEVEWDQVELIIVCVDGSIHKYTVKQSAVTKFEVAHVVTVETGAADGYSVVVMPDALMLSKTPNKMWADKSTKSTVYFVQKHDLSLRDVVLHKVNAEEGKV